MNNYSRNSRSQSESQKTIIKWAIIVGIIIFLFLIKSWFWGGKSDENSSYILFTPRDGSEVFIAMSTSTKNRVEQSEKLYTSDKSISVSTGSTLGENAFLKIDLDRNSELSYISHSATGEVLTVTKGRSWVVAKESPVNITLKNFTASLSMQGICMVEQNNAFSIAYGIQGVTRISTSVGDFDLEPGQRIMIAGSDLTSDATSLSSLSGPIDDSIVQNDLFIRNNGASYLQNISTRTASGTELTSSGSTGTTSPGMHVIEVTDPQDGSIAKTATITIMGNILSKEVKRVTIDDKDASVSPVNETFVMQNVPVEKDISNFVFKAYDENNSLMEKGVFVVFRSKGAQANQGRLVSNNFPISNKDFHITFPTENPYKTTDNFVKVQGSVPKDTVQYIVVNDYRLQKYIPNSTVWYYYANTDTKSMTEGINLYTIKFYGENDTLLYSQLFTIVKESKNASVSGENN